MKVYPPFTLTLEESEARLEEERNEANQAESVSDETLIEYSKRFIEVYRDTLETHFPQIAPYNVIYNAYPYTSNIVRMGPNGVLIYHTFNGDGSVSVTAYEDLPPPHDYNVLELEKRFSPCWGEFDFSWRRFGLQEAEIRARSHALDNALQLFWLLVDAATFREICLRLIRAEVGNKLDLIKEPNAKNLRIDLVSNVLIEEPAAFRRSERWAFELKHHKEDRISAEFLSEIESVLDEKGVNFDIICLVTSGDITSIGKAIAVRNPRIRVWDRGILNILFNKHLEIVEDVFAGYRVAADSIATQIDRLRLQRHSEFEQKLKECPSGHASFSRYENICHEIIEYIFEGKLKGLETQSGTADETQRRDLIFRNLRTDGFFERIFIRFNADFVIFDCKNYGKPISKGEFESIAKYPNDALGNFAVLISRKGENERARATQNRIYANDRKVILSLSDADLLEMVYRKEKGENPEDLLEDLLDKLLLDY